ncbi:hypothetical protein EJ04DRAFT_297220 [Polyplosphaeria fusca]|uniref:Uncharacterized protein n=1 Tax=Polyplosphaeria fusca TaxID=682080 RepID=A0A9P4QUK9_9PLEO|nr:hypothetical protein EJ04DRAFT_297220 [Polyplosphaeria fusca]
MQQERREGRGGLHAERWCASTRGEAGRHRVALSSRARAIHPLASFSGSALFPDYRCADCRYRRSFTLLCSLRRTPASAMTSRPSVNSSRLAEDDLERSPISTSPRAKASPVWLFQRLRATLRIRTSNTHLHPALRLMAVVWSGGREGGDDSTKDEVALAGHGEMQSPLRFQMSDHLCTGLSFALFPCLSHSPHYSVISRYFEY